jgi:uncharacterized phage infection (PIP) family protein YhgE
MSDSKFGQELQKVAISNISDDIKDILNSLEKITKDIPEEVSKQISSLNEDINSLSLALKDVPDRFDLDFSRKINRILEVAAEIESHTKNYKRSLVVDLEFALSGYVKRINTQLDKQIGDRFLLKDTSLYFTVFLTSILGSLFGGGVLAGIVYFFI